MPNPKVRWDPKDDIKIIIKIDRLKFPITVNKDWTLEKMLEIICEYNAINYTEGNKKTPYIYPDSEFYLKTQKLNMKDKLDNYAPVGGKEKVITIKRVEEDEEERVDINFIIRYYNQDYRKLLREKEYKINVDPTWIIKQLKKYLSNRKDFKIPWSANISYQDRSPGNISLKNFLGDSDKIQPNRDLYCYIEENPDEKSGIHLSKIDRFTFKLKGTVSYGTLLQKYRTGKLISKDGQKITPISTSENLCIFSVERSEPMMHPYTRCSGGWFFTKDYTEEIDISIDEDDKSVEICPYWDGAHAEKVITTAAKSLIAKYITKHPGKIKNPNKFKLVVHIERYNDDEEYEEDILPVKFGKGFDWYDRIGSFIDIQFDE